MNDIIERIKRETGVPDIAQILFEKVEHSDLQSLLLEVYRRKAKTRSPCDRLLSGSPHQKDLSAFQFQ
jgi:hypothetical protein